MVKVLVCDDEGPRASGVSQRLKRRVSNTPDYEIGVISQREFIDAIRGLEQRQLISRDADKAAWSSPNLGDSYPKHPFDDTDILFVDYDLARLSSDGKSTAGGESGERVCYLARCYSTCGLIIGYNQFSYHAEFDLTLRGHIRSYADLNISVDLASYPGLWSDDYTGFRPWSWPVVTVFYEQFNRRANAIAEHLNDSILATLGLDSDDTYDLFTREQLELLSPKVAPKLATFEDFVRGSSLGLRPRDFPFGTLSAARIASARIGKWLERAVLPHQNILVDAPHLVSRFPSLLPEPHTDEQWDSACRLTVPPSELGLNAENIQSYEFAAKDWLSRPTWLWPRIATDENIPEVRDPWSPREDRLVFCEDVSRFRPRRNVTEFDADVSPEFGRRYIQKLKSVQYAPTVRLLTQVLDA